MINDLDETIRQMLKAEIPIKNGEIEVRFDQPTSEWSAKLNRPTLNFFLYDTRENAILRQHQWQQVFDGSNGHPNQASLKRTPFRIDCHYMMTAWVPSGRGQSDDEHRLLTLGLLALLRNPTMPEAHFQGQMQQQAFEVPCRTAADDKLTNPAEIWSALDNQMRPAVSYQVTIALDPWQMRTEELVRHFTMRLGVARSGYRQSLDMVAAEKIYIGGQITADGKPVAEVVLQVDGTGLRTETDENGRYRLGNLSAGNYTLVAVQPDGKQKEISIKVPGTAFNFEL